MRMAKTEAARHRMRCARAIVKEVADTLTDREDELTEDEQFEILWNLAWVQLRDLEGDRIPV